MQPKQLFLRCFAEQKEGQWQAFCLEFDLAAQADTLDEVKRKLEEMIFDYVNDALAGEDQAFAEQLLSRRAPLSLHMRYHLMKLRNKLHMAHNGVRHLFNEKMPLIPADHRNAG